MAEANVEEELLFDNVMHRAVALAGKTTPH